MNPITPISKIVEAVNDIHLFTKTTQYGYATIEALQGLWLARTITPEEIDEEIDNQTQGHVHPINNVRTITGNQLAADVL